MKRVASFLLIVCLFFQWSFSVYADSDEDDDDDNYDVPWLFLQGAEPWGSQTFGGGSQTLGSIGCAVTSMAILMAYADEGLRDPETFNPKICADNYLRFDNQCIYWTPVDGPLTLADSEVSFDNSSESALTESMRKVLDEGYYVIMWGSDTYEGGTHFSPIVGWDDEKDCPLVWDTAAGFTGFDWHGFAHATTTGNIHVYKADVPSYEVFGDVASHKDSKVLDEKGKNSLIAVKNQWELVGMPQISQIAKHYELPRKASRDNLSTNMLISMNVIQEGLKEGVTFTRILRIIASFLGLMLIIYAILLVLCSVFDRQNNFVDVSLVSVITFGKLRLLGYGEEITDELKKDGYVPYKILYIRCLIVLIVGMLLVSGVLWKAAYIFGNLLR